LTVMEATAEGLQKARETEVKYDMYPEFWTHEKLN